LVALVEFPGLRPARAHMSILSCICSFSSLRPRPARPVRLACAALVALLIFPLAGSPALAQDPGWAMYNKSYDGQRFAGLAQINVGNVHGLQELCRIKIAKGGSFHTGPLVVDGVMYVTTPRSTIALDARTCALRWRSLYQPEQEEVWAANRGVAYHDGRLYRGTADGRILALDARTGQVLWKTAGGDPAKGEFFSSAPIAWGKLLYIGIAGGDWGIRGRMMAFDLASGREAWRFNTVPMPHEPGAETWEIAATAQTGGGGTWGSYALDTARGEVFVPVANPAPDFAPHVRPGANLYTNSVVVLDAASGKLKWWYQLAPNDGHDYGIGAGPMLYRRSDGKDAVALAAKDGFVYVVDRATQRLLFRTATTTIENAGCRRFRPPTQCALRRRRRLVLGHQVGHTAIQGGAPLHGGQLYPGDGAARLGQLHRCRQRQGKLAVSGRSAGRGRGHAYRRRSGADRRPGRQLPGAG